MKRLIGAITLVAFLALNTPVWAARGFGATDGAGATDAVTTTYGTNHAQASYAVWVWITGSGGGGLGRVFDKDRLGSGHVRLTEVGLTTINFTHSFSTTQGEWTVPIPSTGAWHHLAVTYDNSNVANNPIVYIDGVSATVTEIGTPSGTAGSSAGAFIIGNRDSGDRALNGRVAGFGIWNRILSAGEVATLAAGADYACMASGLVAYWALAGASPEPDSVGGANGTVTGTAVVASPSLSCATGTSRLNLMGVGR